MTGERHRVRDGLSACRLPGGGVRLEHWGEAEGVSTVLESDDFTAEEWVALVAAVAADPGGDDAVTAVFNRRATAAEVAGIHLGRRP